MSSSAFKPLAELQQLEDQISPGTFSGDGMPWYHCIEGTIPVLVSAPHACRHMRDGREKMAEEYTAAMAMYLADATGCHAIYTTRKSSEDPNWNRHGSYKASIADIAAQHQIKFLIDLHGMTNRHHMGVALGTMHGRAAKHSDVLKPFEQHNFVAEAADAVPAPLQLKQGVQLPEGVGAEQHWQRVVVDHPLFTGGVRNHTVTRFAVEQLNLSAVQIEIASVNRIVHRPAAADWPFDYRGNPQGIMATVNALTALVNSL